MLGLSTGICDLSRNNCNRFPSESLAESLSPHRNGLDAVRLLMTAPPAPEKNHGKGIPKVSL